MGNREFGGKAENKGEPRWEETPLGDDVGSGTMAKR